MPNLVDLSLEIYHECPVHPEDPRIGFLNFARLETHGCNMTQIFLSSHGGTHLDAPYHFIASGRTVDQIDLNKCVGKALVIDLSARKNHGDITVEELRHLERKIQRGSRILLRTDWHKKFDQKGYYTDFDGVGLKLAQWLAERDVALIGVETPAIHPKDFKPVHEALLSRDVVIVEGLAYLDHLTQNEVFFIALPLKFRGLDGSPVRAVALEE